MDPRPELAQRPKPPPAMVLLVEDHDASREVLAEVLREEGFVVHEASSAAAARRALEALRFDVVVSDEVLSGESGSALLERARGLGLVPSTGVLLITGHPRMSGTGLPLLRKPFDLATFVAAVRRCLSGQNQAMGANVSG